MTPDPVTPHPGTPHPVTPRPVTPRTVPHPRRWFMRIARPPARALVRRRFTVRVHGADNHPTRGPVVVASNHIGLADGPLMVAFGPRPVHALTKQEAFTGKLGLLLSAAGQVPLDRFAPDPGAIRSCLRVLGAGGVVGVFPEGRRGTGDLGRFHRGAGYLAMVTGATVVPLTVLGTREPGGSAESWPARGAVVDLVYGRPFTVDAVPWPRTQARVRQVSLELREHMRTELARALELTGRTLPGPVDATELDVDPPTALVDD